MALRFDGYVLDELTVELRKDGEAVPVEPQVFDLLLYLITHRDRVVLKTELLDVVWGDQFVSESALTTCIKQARQAVGDNGQDQRVIKTARGKGYRFVADVESDGEVPTGRPGVPVPVERSRSTSDGAADRTPAVTATRKPGSTLPLRGRDADVAAVRHRLENRRLVTVVGMGGIGKTHLLQHLDGELATNYSDGSALVELAPIRTPDAVGAALTEMVPGADKGAIDQIEVLLDWLQHRRMLLLIDNAEHLANEVAGLCRQILERCPDVDVIVTSRTRLDIPGESVHPLGPLELDSAVDLFVERAFDSGADLDPGHTELRDLCQKLDGVPLAIEIVAARAPLLSVADLTGDLERHLAATHPSEDERHRTLEATLQWSLDGLDQAERELLEDLTVLAGSFDLAAAEAVYRSDDVTDPLLSLCRRSLVLPGPQGDASRFRLLEPVRLFAAPSGDAIHEAKRRQADHYRDLAIHADQLIASHDIDRGILTVRMEWQNMRAAFSTYASARDVEAMTTLVVATVNYAEARLLVELHQWADRAHAIALADNVTPDPLLVANLARFCAHVGDLDRIAPLLVGLDSDHPSNHVRFGFMAGNWYQGKVDEVADVLDKALEEVAGDGGYWEATMATLRLLAATVRDERPFHLLDRLEALADTDGVSGALYAQVGRGVRLYWEGRPELGGPELDQAAATAEALGASGFAQMVHRLRTATGQLHSGSERSIVAIVEWIERAVEFGGWAMAAEGLGSAAQALMDGGRPDIAAQLLAARRSAGYRFSRAYEDTLQADIAAALDPLDREANEQVGLRLSLVAAVDLAVEELRRLAETD